MKCCKRANIQGEKTIDDVGVPGFDMKRWRAVRNVYINDERRTFRWDVLEDPPSIQCVHKFATQSMLHNNRGNGGLREMYRVPGRSNAETSANNRISSRMFFCKLVQRNGGTGALFPFI